MNPIIDRIGNTPLIHLESVSRVVGSRIFLKYEAANPFGSSSDRTALGFLRQGIAKGEVKSQACVIAACSGDLAVSLAYLCALQNITLFLVMPRPESAVFPSFLRELKAEVVLTPPENGMKGAVDKADFIKQDIWRSYYCDQFRNCEGVHIHYRSTGTELVRQCMDMGISPAAFVSCSGSGATLMGAGSRLKESFPDVKLVAVEPAESPVLSGGKVGIHGYRGIGINFIPEILDLSKISRIIPIALPEAVRACRHLFYKEGIPCGATTGANLRAALRLAAEPPFSGKDIVLMGHGSMERDLLTRIPGMGRA